MLLLLLLLLFCLLSSLSSSSSCCPSRLLATLSVPYDMLLLLLLPVSRSCPPRLLAILVITEIVFTGKVQDGLVLVVMEGSPVIGMEEEEEAEGFASSGLERWEAPLGKAPLGAWRLNVKNPHQP